MTWKQHGSYNQRRLKNLLHVVFLETQATEARLFKEVVTYWHKLLTNLIAQQCAAMLSKPAFKVPEPLMRMLAACTDQLKLLSWYHAVYWLWTFQVVCNVESLLLLLLIFHLPIGKNIFKMSETALLKHSRNTRENFSCLSRNRWFLYVVLWILWNTSVFNTYGVSFYSSSSRYTASALPETWAPSTNLHKSITGELMTVYRARLWAFCSCTFMFSKIIHVVMLG